MTSQLLLNPLTHTNMKNMLNNDDDDNKEYAIVYILNW